MCLVPVTKSLILHRDRLGGCTSLWWPCLVSIALSPQVWPVSQTISLGMSILISGKAKQRNNRIPKRFLGSKSNTGYRRLCFLSAHGNFHYWHWPEHSEKGSLKIYWSMLDHHLCEGGRTDYTTYGGVFSSMTPWQKSFKKNKNRLNKTKVKYLSLL